LQVIFRKRATNYRALLRTMISEDKASYGSLPLCTYIHQHTNTYTNAYLYTCQRGGTEPGRRAAQLSCSCPSTKSTISPISCSTCCSTVQCVTVCCSVLQRVVVCYKAAAALSRKITFCQFRAAPVAVWCSVLHCGAVCPSVLQCVAVHI